MRDESLTHDQGRCVKNTHTHTNTASTILELSQKKINKKRHGSEVCFDDGVCGWNTSSHLFLHGLDRAVQHVNQNIVYFVSKA